MSRVFDSKIIGVKWIETSDQRLPEGSYKPIPTRRIMDEKPPLVPHRKYRRNRMRSSSVPMKPY